MSRKLIVEVVGDSSSFERSLGRATTSTKQFSREFSRAERGVLAGSGVFRSLGRTLAFASGGFLAFGGASAFIRKSIDAAKEAQVTQRQLAQQFENNGKSLAPYRDQIDKTILRLSALAGIENDELKAGLITILRTVPNVGKALRDLAIATDLARAKKISLAQAATIIAKTEAGNTTLLRRQGFEIAKHAKVEEALAVVRAKVAGQARAGTTEQERFGAVLHDTEEIIGTGILPVLNKYLASGTRWLQQMNESGKLQRNVSEGAHDFAAAIGDAASVVKTVDRVTGGFKNTLELLLALKLASVVTGWAGSFAHAASQERGASKEADILRTRLGLLPEVVVVTIAIEVLLNKKKVDKTVGDFLDKHGLGFLGGTKENTINLPANVTSAQLDVAIEKLRSLKGSGDIAVKALEKLRDRLDKAASSAGEMGVLTAEAGAKAAHGLALAAEAAGTLDNSVARSVNITASQRNTFFDNMIARILLRGGLGSIDQQISALEKADTLIEKRLQVTKDVTRRLNLEDELLQNQAQIRSLRQQRAQELQQALADARQKRIDALAKQAAARNARQFRALGLTATGDEPVPGVKALRRALGNVQTEIVGTFLDTDKTRSLLNRIRKVLSGGLGVVGRDVRSKIQQILGDLNKQLDQQTTKNLTKWKHLSSQAFLSGIPDLTPAQRKLLSEKLATLGPGGTVPPRTTAAFALAGGGATVQGDVYLDGEKVGRVTHSASIKRSKKRSTPRNG